MSKTKKQRIKEAYNKKPCLSEKSEQKWNGEAFDVKCPTKKHEDMDAEVKSASVCIKLMNKRRQEILKRSWRITASGRFQNLKKLRLMKARLNYAQKLPSLWRNLADYARKDMSKLSGVP